MTADESARQRQDATYRRILSIVGSGYLRNTIREPHVTCEVCTGPIEPRYSRCYRCKSDSDTAAVREMRLANLVVPLMYGVARSQSGYIMRNYKQALGTDRLRQQLRLLLALALTLHRACIETRIGRQIEVWTSVPSTIGRIGEHPLRVVARGAKPAPAEAVLLGQSRAPVGNPRSYDPARWMVQQPKVVAGRHVLVIDDTWTTGGHAQSAASVLLSAGAAAVTILVLARWLDPTYGTTGRFITDRLNSDYDPMVCPITSIPCR